MIVRSVIGALCGAVLLVGGAGCAVTVDRGKSVTVAQARSQAVTVFREVTALAPGTWSDVVPDPVSNDCNMGGNRGVQFTYFAEVDAPADPRVLVEGAAAHWRGQSYEVTETDMQFDEKTGPIFAITARASDKPRVSMSATRIRAHVSVDSVCVGADPDDYR